MKYITKETKERLEERGIDLSTLEDEPTSKIPQNWVIDHFRDEYGIIVDVRYTNFGLKYNFPAPHYYGMIFKENRTAFMREVPQQTTDYYEMAEFAIIAALDLIHNK